MISADHLREMLHYDPETGIFRWRLDRSGRTKAGSIAGTLIQDRIYIKIKAKLRLAHRLAWLYMNGSMPDGHIDHRDGNPSNNAWVNLRACSHAQNCQNRKISKRNKSGFLGVSPHTHGWQAVIKKNGKQYYLGLFKDPEEAHEAYLKAKAELHTFNPVPREGSTKCQQN